MIWLMDLLNMDTVLVSYEGCQIIQKENGIRGILEKAHFAIRITARPYAGVTRFPEKGIHRCVFF